MKKVLMTSVVVLTMALTAQGMIETSFDLIWENAMMEGTAYNVFAIDVTTDTDWTSSRLEIALSAGSFGSSSFAFSSWCPLPPDVIPLIPISPYDSYVQTPDGLCPNTAGSVVFPANPGDTEVAITWFDTEDTGPGAQKIGQLALSLDAEGTVSGTSYDIETAGVGVDVGVRDGAAGYWTIGPDRARPNVEPGHFHWIPEPATLSLLAFGVVLLRPLCPRWRTRNSSSGLRGFGRQ